MSALTLQFLLCYNVMASALHWVPMETVWEYSVQPRSSEWLVDIDAGEWLTSGVNGTFPSYLFEDLVSGVIYDATVYARTTLNLPKSGQDKPPQFRLACSCEYPALVFVNRMPFDRMCGSSLSNTLEGAVEMGSRSNNADQILLPLSPLSVGLHWLLPERKHQFVLPKCRIDASKTVSETRSLRSGQRRLLQASTPATPSISPTVSISDTVSVSASVSASASLASVSVTPSITPSISITPTPYPSGPDQIPSTGDWLYYDVGNVPTGAWTSTSYDDSAWANGRTPAGYSFSNIFTTLYYGPVSVKKYVTTYFRYKVPFTRLSGTTYSGTFQIQAVDGAVVYLNGNEIGRINMPAAPTAIVYGTPASSGLTAVPPWQTLQINDSQILNGVNVMAVEIHKVNGGWKYLYFDASLLIASTPSATPTASVSPSAGPSPISSPVAASPSPSPTSSTTSAPGVTASVSPSISESTSTGSTPAASSSAASPASQSSSSSSLMSTATTVSATESPSTSGGVPLASGPSTPSLTPTVTPSCVCSCAQMTCCANATATAIQCAAQSSGLSSTVQYIIICSSVTLAVLFMAMLVVLVWRTKPASTSKKLTERDEEAGVQRSSATSLSTTNTGGEGSGPRKQSTVTATGSSSNAPPNYASGDAEKPRSPSPNGRNRVYRRGPQPPLPGDERRKRWVEEGSDEDGGSNESERVSYEDRRGSGHPSTQSVSRSEEEYDDEWDDVQGSDGQQFRDDEPYLDEDGVTQRQRRSSRASANRPRYSDEPLDDEEGLDGEYPSREELRDDDERGRRLRRENRSMRDVVSPRASRSAQRQGMYRVSGDGERRRQYADRPPVQTMTSAGRARSVDGERFEQESSRGRRGLALGNSGGSTTDAGPAVSPTNRRDSPRRRSPPRRDDGREAGADEVPAERPSPPKKATRVQPRQRDQRRRVRRQRSSVNDSSDSSRLAPGDGSVSTRTDFFVLEDGPPRPHTVECLSCGGVSASDAAYCPHCGYAGSAMDANESPRLPPPPRPYAQPPPLSVTKDVITDGKRYVVQRVPSQVSYEPPSVDAPSRTPVTAPQWPSPARAVSSSASYSHVSSSESGPRMATASPWMPRAPSSDEPRRLKLVRVKHVKLSQADSRASSHSVHTPAPVQFFY